MLRYGQDKAKKGTVMVKINSIFQKRIFRCFFTMVITIVLTIGIIHFALPPAQPRLNAGKAIAAGASKMDMKVVAMGDSLTEGVGDDYHEGGYVPYLTKGLDEVCNFRSITCENYGKSGNRTVQLTKRIQDSIEIQEKIKNADVITITIGANDLLKVAKDNIFNNLMAATFKEPQVEYKQNIAILYEEIRKYNPDCPIYQLGIYNPFFLNFKEITELQEVINQWNATTKEFIEEQKEAYFIPINDQIYQGMGVSDDGEFINNLLSDKDSFHPNTIGYQIIANAFRDKLLETQESWILKK